MKNDKNFIHALTPSWVTNFIGLSAGILVTAVVIIISRYQGSGLRQQIFEAQNGASPATAQSTYHTVTQNFADNRFLDALPMLLVWACVGLIVYFFATSIGRLFGQAAALHEQLGYVNVSRQTVIRQALQQLGLQSATTICWFVFIKLSLSIFIPYALAAANIASESLSLSSAGYAALAVIVWYTDIWGHAIFLRLITLRARLFG